MHEDVHGHVNTHVHACVHAHGHVHMRACAWTCAWTRACGLVHGHAHMCIRFQHDLYAHASWHAMQYVHALRTRARDVYIYARDAYVLRCVHLMQYAGMAWSYRHARRHERNGSTCGILSCTSGICMHMHAGRCMRHAHATCTSWQRK